MKKIVSFALSLCLFALFITPSLAHTSLDQSTPAANSLVEDEMTELSVSFTGGIEAASTLTLVDKDGVEIPVTVEVAEQSMKATVAEPLASGAYTMNWKIVSLDGHLQEGQVPFVVSAPTKETPENDTTTNDATDENATSAPAEEEQLASEETEEEYSSTPLLIAIGVAAVVIIGLLIFAFRKK